MIEGQCRCGAVRYTIDVEALPPSYACHCHICQRYSGSAFSQQIVVAEDRLSVTGPVEIYEIVTGDRTSVQRFCETCHTRVYNTNTRRPDVAVVRAGTLARSEELQCVAHIYTDFRQRWFELPEGVPSWGEAAPPAEFFALLTRVA
jgi:hypothetical protein